MAEYAHPDVLVDADWVEQHQNDPQVRIVESDEDLLLYGMGHVPGAVKISWHDDLQDPISRDYISDEKFAAICSRNGISNNTTVVFYGDNSNWWACYALWAFKLKGHRDCRIMNGGRKLWIDENRSISTETPTYPAANYQVAGFDELSIRAFREHALAHSNARLPMIDVRSPKEFTGEMLHMENYPQEGSLRAGHIPGAKNVPWSRAVDPQTGKFLTADQLKELYEGSPIGLKPTDDVIAYCRIGERSSLTWFVLTYLLGYKKVRNYDGSWTEWGNLVRVPIEKGP